MTPAVHDDGQAGGDADKAGDDGDTGGDVLERNGGEEASPGDAGEGALVHLRMSRNCPLLVVRRIVTLVFWKAAHFVFLAKRPDLRARQTVRLGMVGRDQALRRGEVRMARTPK